MAQDREVRRALSDLAHGIPPAKVAAAIARPILLPPPVADSTGG